jgi:hypothetical protein
VASSNIWERQEQRTKILMMIAFNSYQIDLNNKLLGSTALMGYKIK